MPSYELLNLYVHPAAAAQPWRVGPFTVRFVQDYGTRWIHSQSATLTEPVVTATAQIDDPGEALMALPPLPGETPEPAVWDLTQILSYLTGRRVMLSGQAGRYSSRKVAFEITDDEETHRAAATAWANRTRLGPSASLSALWLYLQAMSTVEAEIRGASVCVALENVVRDVAGDEIGAEAPGALREAIEDVIRDFAGLTQADRDRFKSSVEYWGKPGLNALVRNYVAHYGLATLTNGSLAKKRATHVAEVRNGLLHAGQIRQPGWITDDDDERQDAYRRSGAVFYVAQLIPALVQVHLDHLFGIEGYEGPRRTHGLVREYFAEGTWAGDAVEAGALLGRG